MAAPSTPLEFQHSERTFWATVAGGVLIAGLMIALAVWNFHDPEMYGEWLTVAIAVGFTAYAIYAAVAARVFSIRLYKDRIEQQSLFRQKTMLLADIAGWRAGDSGEIHLEYSNQKPGFILPKALIRDHRWEGWLNSLTSLEAQEANAQFDAVEADSRLGDNAGERVKKANIVRRIAFYAFLVGCAIVLWGFAYPRPYKYAMLANGLLPILALVVVWRWRDFFTLDGAEAKRGGQGDLSYLFLWPGVILALRVMIDVHMLDWTGAILAGAAGSAVVGFAAMRLHKYDRLSAAWVFISLLGWAGGSALIANELLDTAKPAVVRATVIEFTESDRDPSITVQTVGAAPTRISDLDTYDIPAAKLAPGSVVCLDIHSGRFGWRYVYAATCPPA